MILTEPVIESEAVINTLVPSSYMDPVVRVVGSLNLAT